MNTQYRGHDANDDLFRIYLGPDLICQSFGFFRGRIMENSNLASDNVFSILEDRRGVLWVASFFGGLSYLDPSSNSFVNFVPYVDD